MDKFWHKKYIEITDGITRVDGNVAAIDFPDDSFDVVTCQEVLEHLPEEIFTRAIEELRRVCRGQLIITVPYREPEPIPKFHVRRFEDEDLARLFPHADFALLRRPRRPWILIEERPNEPVRRIAVTGGCRTHGSGWRVRWRSCSARSTRCAAAGPCGRSTGPAAGPGGSSGGSAN